jgi:hypothetical protein
VLDKPSFFRFKSLVTLGMSLVLPSALSSRYGFSGVVLAEPEGLPAGVFGLTGNTLFKRFSAEGAENSRPEKVTKSIGNSS